MSSKHAFQVGDHVSLNGREWVVYGFTCRGYTLAPVVVSQSGTRSVLLDTKSLNNRAFAYVEKRATPVVRE